MKNIPKVFLNDIDDSYIDELQCAEYHNDLWEEGYLPMIEDETIRSCNIFRRILDIFLYLSDIYTDPEKKDFIAYETPYKIYRSDNFYVDTMLGFLKKYNWEIPEGFYSRFDGNASVELTESDKIVELYELYNDFEAVDRFTNSHYLTLTLHSWTFDQVYHVHLSIEALGINDDMEEECKEYSQIYTMLNHIAESFWHNDYEFNDMVTTEKGEFYIVSIKCRYVEASWETFDRNVIGLLRPYLFDKIPVLEALMEAYLQKWCNRWIGQAGKRLKEVCALYGKH